ncbi:MAG: hypothetical protein LBG68_03485, partial [Coriobacteriales bacterium]|nr:hypothetical protein [Coriobacteriales bacterium]
MMTFRIYRQRLASKLQPAHWLTALLALLISFTLVSSPLFASTDSDFDSEQGIEAGADAAADTVSSPESAATNDAQPDEPASDLDSSGSAEPERELTYDDESSTSQTDVVDSLAETSDSDSALLSPDGVEVEPGVESDAEQLEFFYLTSPQLPTASGIRSRSMSGPAAPYIEARVELFPPSYAYAPNNPSQYGFKGEQWGHIAEYGFTAAYNSVSISQGYDGNDWLYGVTGRVAEEAEFAANSTIHCMQPGLAPPCPGGDNVRFITMSYVREIFIGDSPYYLYWGMSKFYYDPDYAYTEEGQSMGFYIAIPKSYSVDVLKVDIDSHEPLSDTEFTLLKYPVTLVDGWVTTDISTISADDPAWQAIGKLCTDQYGRVSFSHLGFGYYQVIESRPNPLYKSYRESGGTAHFQLIDRDHQQPIMQYFEDDKIEIGVEVYKDTVNVTSAAFATDTDDYLSINNIDKEIYHYNLYFRSTSNVRADEFTVVDPLENVASQQVRVIEVFTPVAWGDSDGLFNLWYQTNYTDGSKSYSDVTALGSNPDNPNNPNRTQVWPSLGWQLWQANIPTTSSSNLKVVDLGLAADEYITALRFEYGSVEVG